MKKILLTTIGGSKNDTGKEYHETDYLIDGKVYGKKKFILSALDEHHNFDKIFVLGTTGSMWDAFYEYICNISNIRENTEENYIKISDQCINASYDTPLETYNLDPIKEILPDKYRIKLMRYGINNDEMIYNFKVLFEIIDELDDESDIYIDLTHGFRSNAFYMFMVMNYLKEMNNSNDRIKGIFYGMYEYRDRKEKNPPTPVLDLKIFSDISNLLKGVYDINNNGNFYAVANYLKDEKTKETLKEFSNCLNINYIGEVQNKLKSLKSLIDRLNKNESELVKIFVPRVLQKFLEKFEAQEKEYMFLLEISKWYFDQKKYAVAYITIRESIALFFSEIYEVDKDSANDKLNKLTGRRKCENADLKKLIDIFKRCRDIRNNIAHASDTRINSTRDIKVLKEDINLLKNLFKNKTLKNYITNQLDID